MAGCPIGVGFHMGVPSRAEGWGMPPGVSKWSDYNGAPSYLWEMAQNGHTIFAKGADNAGPCWQVQELQQEFPDVPMYAVYRRTRYSWGDDVPLYNAATPTQMAKRYMDEARDAWPPELDHEFVWFEFPNEPDKNHTGFLAQMAVEAAKIALDWGWKIVTPAWSGGEPEAEHWLAWRDYLRLCEAHPNQLGIALHEYTFDDKKRLLETTPYLIGRVTALNDYCRSRGIAAPTVFLTEWGWGANAAPPSSEACPQIVEALHWYQEYAPNVRGIAIWALDSSGQWSGVSRTAQTYLPNIPPLLTRETWLPSPPTTKPAIPDPLPAANVIKNGSFEEGWMDHEQYPSRIQNPTAWYVHPVPVGEPMRAVNRATGKKERCTGVVEAHHKLSTQLPPDEQLGGANELIREGAVTYKIQAVSMRSETTLAQIVTGLEPRAEYLLHIPVKVHYHPDVSSIGEPDDIEIWLEANDLTGRVSEYFVADLPDRPKQWTILTHTFRADPAGMCEVMLTFFTKWQNSRDVFIDGIWAQSADEPTKPPELKPKIVIFKAAQEHTYSEYDLLAAIAFQEYRRTLTSSHDDMLTMLAAGNSDSYAVVYDPHLPSQKEAIAKLEAAGYNYETRMLDMPIGGDPLDGLKFGPIFNYRYVKTSSFNDSRNYGNGRHEGADYDVIGGDDDNQVDVLCIYPGIVSKVDSYAGGYGNYAVVQHEHNGAKFYTWYGHLDEVYVRVNQALPMGTPIGEVGSTGNSYGEHVHLTLQVPDYGLAGYVVDDVVDPHPYMPYVGDLPLLKPTSGRVDLLAYFRPSSSYGPMYEVRHPSGQTETFQVQHGAGNSFFLVKNNQFETFHFDEEYIWRSVDTSPGGAPNEAERPGAARWYTQYEANRASARWCKRYMAAGDVFNGPGHLVQFYYKDGCTSSAIFSGGATNRVAFIKHYSSKTWNGITVSDVVELSSGNETYYFGRGLGMVAWTMKNPTGESAIVEQLSGRNDLVRESGCFNQWVETAQAQFI